MAVFEQVSGRFLAPDGSPLSGSVVFTPAFSFARDSQAVTLPAPKASQAKTRLSRTPGGEMLPLWLSRRRGLTPHAMFSNHSRSGASVAPSWCMRGSKPLRRAAGLWPRVLRVLARPTEWTPGRAVASLC